MKLTIPLVASAALLLGATSVRAVEDPGASEHTPGHQMQRDDKTVAPGASEYAPGKTKDSDPHADGAGASEYAPGKQANPSATGGKTKDSDPRPE